MTVGRFAILGDWEQETVPADLLPIRLVPSFAFGYGWEPTTARLLELLPDAITKGAMFLDIGAGTGILSIAAAVLGAKAVAFEMDIASAAACKQNALLNGADVEVRAERFPPPDPLPPFDVIACNTPSADLLYTLADLLPASLAPGGVLFATAPAEDADIPFPGCTEVERFTLPLAYKVPGVTRLLVKADA